MTSSAEPRPTGPQVIPRPSDVREGNPAPWRDLDGARRERIGVSALVSALGTAGRALGVSEPPAALDELTGVAPEVTDGLRDSAVLVAAFEEDGEARVVLTRRAGHLRRHRGEVAFPGGRVEQGETALEAALREAHEEVGLSPVAVEPVAWLSPIVTFASGSLIRPFVATLAARPTLAIQRTEVDRGFDVSIAELLADGAFHEERWRRPSPRSTDAEGYFPIYFFDVAGETIWGATARILTELCCLASGVSAR